MQELRRGAPLQRSELKLEIAKWVGVGRKGWNDLERVFKYVELRDKITNCNIIALGRALVQLSSMSLRPCYYGILGVLRGPCNWRQP